MENRIIEVHTDRNFFHPDEIVPIWGTFEYSDNRAGRTIIPEKGAIFIIPKDGMVTDLHNFGHPTYIPKGIYKWKYHGDACNRARYDSLSSSEARSFSYTLKQYGLEEKGENSNDRQD